MWFLLGAAGCGGTVQQAEMDGTSTGGHVVAVPKPAGHAAAAAALASGGAPHGLVVGDDRVCWTDPAGGAVRCVAKSGGDAWTVADGLPGPSGISISRGDAPPSWGAITHDTVYWTDEVDGTVMAATPAGVRSMIAANLDHPRAVVANAGDIYALSELYVSTDGPLVRVWLPGGGGGVTVLADYVGQGDAVGLAVGGYSAFVAPSLEIVPIDGGQGHILTYAAAVHGVASDESSVYFTNGDALVSSPVDGGPLTMLAEGAGTGEGVAVDAVHAYWVTAGTPENGFEDGAVWRVRLDGGPKVAVATGQAHPFAIGLDDDAIYWTVSGAQAGEGAVMKLEKRLVGE
jgi:hypothetical protein